MTEATKPGSSGVLVALVLVVAVVGVNARLVVGGKTWSDVRYHTEVAPPRLAAADAICNGSIPGWWEGSGLGVPLAAEPSHGALYPLTWLATTPRALDWLAILHLVWASLGVAAWARRLGRRAPSLGMTSEQAALVAGLLVGTSGILASAAVRGALPALAHLPWIGVVASLLAETPIEDRRGRARAAIALGVLVGLVGLAGVFGTLVDAVILAVALAARRRTAGDLAAAIGGGVAIAAVQWLPALMNLGGGAPITGMPFARLLELIIPGSFGSPDPDHAIATLAGTAAWAPSVFVGVPLLALSAVRTPARRHLGVIGVFAGLALVVGRGGWPHWIGAPELHLAALAIVLGAHAGAGIDALLAGERRALIAMIVGAGCTGIALAALATSRARDPDIAAVANRALVDAGLCMACVIAVVVVVWRTATPARTGPASIVLALLALPSIGSTGSIAPVFDRANVDEPGAWARAAAPVVDGSHAPARMYRPEVMFDARSAPHVTATVPGTPRPPAPVEVEDTEHALATLAGTSGWKFGIAAARSEDPARHVDMDRAWYKSAREGGALLDRFAIALAILPETLVVPRKFKALAVRGRWALVQLEVAPAASVQRGWSWAVAPDDALSLLYPQGGGTGVLRGSSVLRGGGSSQEDRGPPLACPIDRWEHGAIDVDCTTDVAGYAVVSSSAAAGWSVSVDDGDAEWVTADVLRRGVAIPAGSHRIEWRYTTPGLGLGVLIAGIGIALLVALYLANRRD
ncbi:MAG: hypothetical protein ABI867_04710 [Kofleriaceae bacterium]